MNQPFVPGPDDEFRGIVEIDCTEHLSEEERAAIRVTKFVSETDFCGVIEIDCSQPLAEPTAIPASPGNPAPGSTTAGLNDKPAVGS